MIPDKLPEPVPASRARQYYKTMSRKIDRAQRRAQEGNREATRQAGKLLVELLRGLLTMGWRFTDLPERDEKGEPRIVPMTEEWAAAERERRRQDQQRREILEQEDAEAVKEITRRMHESAAA